jgi:hypothetical protein
MRSRGALRFEEGIRHGGHKNRVFVSIRKSEVAEIARVGGIFNRGVSIKKLVASDEWLVVIFQQVVHSTRTGDADCVEQSKLSGRSNGHS